MWYLDYLEDGEMSPTSDYLIREGRKPTPYFTQIIDLQQPVDVLWRGVRKSYKSLINKKPVISNMDRIEPLRDLHRKCHKRKGRSDATWFVQQKMIWAKEAFCMTQVEFPDLKRPDLIETVAGGLFYYNQHICYYGVGCSLKGTNSHALLWRAIIHARDLGIERFDMGQQHHEGDPKLVNISKFKRGFGGQPHMYAEFKREKDEKDNDSIGVPPPGQGDRQPDSTPPEGDGQQGVGKSMSKRR